MKTPANRRGRAGGEGGFTLVEVLIAMAIIAVTAVVLLDQRMVIVQDAAKARDKRVCWILASQKLAELELDPKLWVGMGGQNNGDFSDVDPEYAPFVWEYQIVREVIKTGNPVTDQVKPDDANKKELYRLTLTVRAPGIDDPIVLEGEFPTTPPPAEGTDASKDGQNPQKPPDSAGLPAGGGPPK